MTIDPESMIYLYALFDIVFFMSIYFLLIRNKPTKK